MMASCIAASFWLKFEMTALALPSALLVVIVAIAAGAACRHRSKVRTIGALRDPDESEDVVVVVVVSSARAGEAEGKRRGSFRSPRIS